MKGNEYEKQYLVNNKPIEWAGGQDGEERRGKLSTRMKRWC